MLTVVARRREPDACRPIPPRERRRGNRPTAFCADEQGRHARARGRIGGLHGLLRVDFSRAPRSARFFRPDNPLLPNYQWIPIGYHREGIVTVAASGGPIHRPVGQTRKGDVGPPSFGHRPVWTMRWNSHLGCGENAIGGNRFRSLMRRSASSGSAPQRLVGARRSGVGSTSRLGPFLSKSFVTTVSPMGGDPRRTRAISFTGLRRRDADGPAATPAPRRRPPIVLVAAYVTL